MKGMSMVVSWDIIYIYINMWTYRNMFWASSVDIRVEYGPVYMPLTTNLCLVQGDRRKHVRP
jgi:hypothetical protein